MSINRNDNVVSTLLPLFEKGNKCNCIAWLGSGLSVPARYPTWIKTLDILCNACKVKKINKKYLSNVDLLLEKAEECKKKNKSIFHSKLASLFGKKVVTTRRAYNIITSIPFKGYITTNFDPLLCMAARDNGNTDVFAYPRLKFTELGDPNKRPIYYIHGLAQKNGKPNGENLVIAKSDFEKAYKDLKSQLKNVLFYYDVIFIGCRLDEPPMKYIFKEVRKAHEELLRETDLLLPKKYILLEEEGFYTETEKIDFLKAIERANVEKDKSERRKYEEMGIEALKYNASKEHSNIEDILSNIWETIQRMPKYPLSGLRSKRK